MSAHCVSPTALPNEKGGRSLSSSCLFQLDECYRADSVVTLLPWTPPYASCACANDILSSPRPIRAATVSAKKRLMFSLLRGVGLTHWELKRRSQRGVVRNHTLRSVRAETCPPAPAHSSPCCPDCVFGSHDGSALCPAKRSCTGLAGSCVIAIALRRFQACRSTVADRIYVAIASNITFILWSQALNIWPVLVLHTALLPLNVIRLVQIRRMLSQIDVVPVSTSVCSQ